MAMQYRSTKTPGKNYPPTPVNREQWGTASRSYDPEINNHAPTPITEYSRVVHPLTGAYITGLAFQQEINDVKTVYGGWPEGNTFNGLEAVPDVSRPNEELSMPSYPTPAVTSAPGTHYF